MPEYKEIDGEVYRVVQSRYNGVNVPRTLVPEETYKTIKNAKKSLRNKRRTPRKVLEERLDIAWSEKVKEVYNYKCGKCGSADKRLNSHHIFSRSRKATRWDIKNGICLCVGCHTFGKDSAHLNPKSFMEWLIRNKGEDYVKNIEWRSKSTIKYSIGDLEMLLKTLKVA